MSNYHFGENLRTIRVIKGISQAAMAANLKISQASYSRIETQATNVSDEQVIQIAKILDVNPSEISTSVYSSEKAVIDPSTGLGRGGSSNVIFNSRLSKILSILAAVLLAPIVYEGAQGFCDGYGTTESTKEIVKWVASLSVFPLVYFVSKRYLARGI